MMSAAAVCAVPDLLAQHTVVAWLDGGWGVDALPPAPLIRAADARGHA